MTHRNVNTEHLLSCRWHELQMALDVTRLLHATARCSTYPINTTYMRCLPFYSMPREHS